MSPSSLEHDPIMFSTRVPVPGAAPRRRRLSPLAGGLFAAAVFAVAVRGQPPAVPPPPPGGPVAALQDMLREEAGPDLAARKAKINQLIAQMDLEQLSRVLLLADWRTLESAVPKSDAERVRIQGDLQARGDVAVRFRDKAKEAMKAAKAAPTGTTPEEHAAADLDKAAVAALIGETADAGRKLDYLSQMSSSRGPRGGTVSQIGYLAGQLSELTPDLIDLTKFSDTSVPAAAAQVRRSAARALGEIQPANPTQVIDALGQILADKNNSLDLRLTAAQAMDQLAQAAAEEMQRSLGLDEAVRDRFLDFAQAVWRSVLQNGLPTDQPLEVRRTCLRAFGRIATEMLDISVVPQANESPPSELDPMLIQKIQEGQSRYFHRLADVFTIFPKNSASLAAAVRDDDPEVRQTALSILVDLANVRDRLQHLAAGGTPLPSAEPGPGGPTPTEGKKIPPDAGKKIPPEAARDLGAALILIAADEPTREKSQQQAFEGLARGLDKTIGPLVQALARRTPRRGGRRRTFWRFSVPPRCRPWTG